MRAQFQRLDFLFRLQLPVDANGNMIALPGPCCNGLPIVLWTIMDARSMKNLTLA